MSTTPIAPRPEDFRRLLDRIGQDASDMPSAERIRGDILRAVAAMEGTDPLPVDIGIIDPETLVRLRDEVWKTISDVVDVWKAGDFDWRASARPQDRTMVEEFDRVEAEVASLYAAHDALHRERDQLAVFLSSDPACVGLAERGWGTPAYRAGPVDRMRDFVDAKTSGYDRRNARIGELDDLIGASAGILDEAVENRKRIEAWVSHQISVGTTIEPTRVLHAMNDRIYFPGGNAPDHLENRHAMFTEFEADIDAMLLEAEEAYENGM